MFPNTPIHIWKPFPSTTPATVRSLFHPPRPIGIRKRRKNIRTFLMRRILHSLSSSTKIPVPSRISIGPCAILLQTSTWRHDSGVLDSFNGPRSDYSLSILLQAASQSNFWTCSSSGVSILGRLVTFQFPPPRSPTEARKAISEASHSLFEVWPLRRQRGHTM